MFNSCSLGMSRLLTTKAILVLVIFSFLRVARGYTWPTPIYDELEDLMVLTTGYGSLNLIGEIDPCSAATFRETETGRQGAAEWIRTAFHDAASYDASTGKGGMDGSIQFELDFPQNAGPGTMFGDTLEPFIFRNSVLVTLSDLIALGTVLAVKNCGGPTISFRGGRVDALVAGPPTIPQPQDSLATLTASFKRMGFTQEEMIGLTACGHTLGGVQQVDFPQVLPNSTTTENNTFGMVHFDNSFASFDNHIAQGWIDGTTKDPLAVGKNKTTNSDARIFAADGNRTMKAFAHDAKTFAKTCANLFERMINLVPKGVKLTDVITPIPVKPMSVQLGLSDEGALLLTGSIRVFDPTGKAFTNETILSITYKNGRGLSCKNCTVNGNSSIPSGSLFGSIVVFDFNTTIDPQIGISSFAVDWAHDNHSKKIRADNNGHWFPSQDVVFWHANQSCASFENGYSIIAVAIRKDMGPVKGAQIIYSHDVNTNPAAAAGNYQNAPPVDLVASGPSSSPLYTLYKAKIPNGFSDRAHTFDVKATVGGKVYADTFKQAFQIFNQC